MKVMADELAWLENGGLSANKIWVRVCHIPQGDDKDEGKIVVSMARAAVANRFNTVWAELFSRDKLDQIKAECDGNSRVAFL